MAGEGSHGLSLVAFVDFDDEIDVGQRRKPGNSAKSLSPRRDCMHGHGHYSDPRHRNRADPGRAGSRSGDMPVTLHGPSESLAPATGLEFSLPHEPLATRESRTDAFNRTDLATGALT